MKESIEIKEKLSEDSKGSCRRIRDRKPERRRSLRSRAVRIRERTSCAPKKEGGFVWASRQD